MEKEKSNVALLSVFAAIFLTGFKLAVGLITGSLGIISEALHSGLDLVAAVITFISVRISDKPADREHHFGHGKVENLSALIETLLLLITCVWIIYEAIDRLVTKNTHIDVNAWSFIVVITSIVIDFSRSRALYKVARKHNSQALEADALHFSTDIWSSGVVLLGLICASLGIFIADTIAALAVAFIVMFVSYRLGKKSIDVLLDKAPLPTINSIEKVLDTIPEIKQYHGLRVRSAGADVFIEVNIHLNPNLKLETVHDICNTIEAQVNAAIPRSHCLVHPEPQSEKHVKLEEGNN